MAQVISQRLRDGRPLWHEQLAFRLAGLGGLWGFALFARWLFWLQQRAPAVAGRPCMLAGCLVAVAVLLPFTPASVYLGFVAPPAFFFVILVAILIFYLSAVEGMKQWFFRRFAAE